jgi:hypothetical protein
MSRTAETIYESLSRDIDKVLSRGRPLDPADATALVEEFEAYHDALQDEIARKELSERTSVLQSMKALLFQVKVALSLLEGLKDDDTSAFLTDVESNVGALFQAGISRLRSAQAKSLTVFGVQDEYVQTASDTMPPNGSRVGDRGAFWSSSREAFVVVRWDGSSWNEDTSLPNVLDMQALWADIQERTQTALVLPRVAIVSEDLTNATPPFYSSLEQALLWARSVVAGGGEALLRLYHDDTGAPLSPELQSYPWYTYDEADNSIRVESVIPEEGYADIMFRSENAGDPIRPRIRFGGRFSHVPTLAGDAGNSGDWTRTGSGWYAALGAETATDADYVGTAVIVDSGANAFRVVQVNMLEAGVVWVYVFDANGSRVDMQGTTLLESPNHQVTVTLRPEVTE